MIYLYNQTIWTHSLNIFEDKRYQVATIEGLENPNLRCQNFLTLFSTQQYTNIFVALLDIYIFKLQHGFSSQEFTRSNCKNTHQYLRKYFGL